MNGKPNVVECAYVKSDLTEASHFATPLVLGVSIINLLFPLFSIHLIQLVTSSILSRKMESRKILDLEN